MGVGRHPVVDVLEQGRDARRAESEWCTGDLRSGGARRRSCSRGALCGELRRNRSERFEGGEQWTVSEAAFRAGCYCITGLQESALLLNPRTWKGLGDRR